MHVIHLQHGRISRLPPFVLRQVMFPYRARRCKGLRPDPVLCNSVRGGTAVGDLALINVDYISPSLWLGVVLGITGMVLYSLKFRDARGTTEGDIVAASLFVMCGGILTLQGWRLDPILMLSEFVLGGVGIFYMVQTVNLRKQLEVCTCYAGYLQKLAVAYKLTWNGPGYSCSMKKNKRRNAEDGGHCQGKDHMDGWMSMINCPKV